MNRLTVEERRRAAELRRTSQTRQLHAIVPQTVPALPPRSTHRMRLAALVTVALGGVVALFQLGQQIAFYGPASLLDWLLPRM